MRQLSSFPLLLTILSFFVCRQIVIRINCLSTEFSPQKGVKGLPLHLVVDTYEDMDTDTCEPAHRGYCRVKIFRDKVGVCENGVFVMLTVSVL